MRYLFSSLLLFIISTLVGQNCQTSYQSFNLIMTEFYVEDKVPPVGILRDLKTDCMGCSEVDRLYEIYGDSIPKDLEEDFLQVVFKYKCRRVDSEKLQKLVDANADGFKRSQEDFLCNYLVRYEQLLRNNADKELFLECDALTHKMLIELLEDTSLTSSCLFPILLHGSDKITAADIPDFERKLKARVRDGNFLNPGAAAMLLDRVYYRSFGHQKYGTMTMYGEFRPIIMDMDQVDAFRKEIGLYPLVVKIRSRDLNPPPNYGRQPRH